MAADAGPSLLEWVIGLAVQSIALIVMGIWRMARIISEERKEIDQSIGNLDHELSRRIEGSEANSRQSMESAQRLYSATVEVVKQELHDHVVYVERNFARRDSFYKAVEEIKSDMKEGFERLENKIDSK